LHASEAGCLSARSAWNFGLPDARRREYVRVGDTSVDSLRAELALLAARFVLPGLGPDVDQSIRVACDLLAQDLETPATVEVAALRYGTPLRDAGPVIRAMLREQGFPAAVPDAGEAEEFTTVLLAVGAGGLQIGEFFIFFMRVIPAWQGQDELQHRLVVLLNAWVEETTAEGRSAIAADVRRVARDAAGDAS
jgi:hypothetical protein